jgi:hypothetical protein
MKKRIPFVQALLWIVLSTFLITGSGYSGMKSYVKWKWKRANHPDYQISAIVQTGPQREALRTVYLSELLGISRDKPQSLYHFDCEKAEVRLLRSPVIKTATIKREPPNTLHVDYSVRQPIAWLADFSNIAIDQDAVPFPVTPFFTPKKLPEIYLDAPASQAPGNGKWHVPLQGKEIQLALTILSLLSEPTYQDVFHVRRIDVSKAYADSYGKREIVLILEDEIFKQEQGREIVIVFPRYLRLSTKQYAQELGNYLKLREELLSQESRSLKLLPNSPDLIKTEPKVIDLRIPHLGYIKNPTPPPVPEDKKEKEKTKPIKENKGIKKS